MGRNEPLGLERRKFPRLKDNIFVFCRSGSTSSDEFKAITCDISGSGLMFETERDITPESKLELEIYQPIKRSKSMIFSVPVLAKVIWMKRIEKASFEKGENKYKLAIEFIEIEKKDRKKIANYIEEKVSKK